MVGCMIPLMRGKTKPQTLDKLMQSLTDCFTTESAQRLVKLKPDPELQARVDELGDKCSSGTLTEEERDEYRLYITFGTFISTLKSQSRLRSPSQNQLEPAARRSDTVGQVSNLSEQNLSHSSLLSVGANVRQM